MYQKLASEYTKYKTEQIRCEFKKRSSSPFVLSISLILVVCLSFSISFVLFDFIDFRCVSEIGLRRLRNTGHRESINFIKKWGRHTEKVSILLRNEKLSLCIRNWPPKIAKNGTQRK